MSYPCPPCCGVASLNCTDCTFDVKPQEWKVDLGAASWVDSGDCDGCDQVAGEYTLTLNSGLGQCVWRYTQDDICTKPGCGCTGSTLSITLYRERISPFVGEWTWRLEVIISWASTTDSKCVRECWRPNAGTSTDTDCLDLGGDGSGNKIQMDAGSCPGTPFCGTSLCTGSLNDPVHIWIP